SRPSAHAGLPAGACSGGAGATAPLLRTTPPRRGAASAMPRRLRALAGGGGLPRPLSRTGVSGILDGAPDGGYRGTRAAVLAVQERRPAPMRYDGYECLRI